MSESISEITKLETLLSKVKAHPRIAEAGMILCHNGIVRQSNRSGDKRVISLKVSVNRDRIQQIKKWAESQQGIIAVEIEALEGEFAVSDNLLFVVVAGDIRENVFSTMRETIEKIKAEGVQKIENYEIS
jgi:molybdopterin synthase catalytic subunit